MDSKLQRIPEIDVLKGMGIVLMVAGHVGFGSTFDFFIHSFHMPMFFIISGYLFNDSRSFGDFIKRKAKTLLVPYAVFGLLNLFAWILVNVVLGDQDVSSIASRLFHLCWVNTEGLPIAGALWFLTALFVAECVFYSLVVISQGELVSTFALSLLCSCFGRALSGVEGVPFGIDSGLVGVGLLGVGHALNKVGGGHSLYELFISRFLPQLVSL